MNMKTKVYLFIMCLVLWFVIGGHSVCLANNNVKKGDGNVITFGLVSQVGTLTNTVNNHTARIETLEGAVKWQELK